VEAAGVEPVLPKYLDHHCREIGRARTSAVAKDSRRKPTEEPAEARYRTAAELLYR
jgi:hypothetical protein